MNKSKHTEPHQVDSTEGPIRFSKEEQEAIDELNLVHHFKKGTILLRAGEIPTKSFYIEKGCVRKYDIQDGEDKTHFFYTEGQSISGSVNYLHKIPSKFYLECSEDSEIKTVFVEKERELCKRFPRFDALCRLATEAEFEKYQEMFATFVASSPKERYLNILKTRPNLVNRVPQYHLASYLGVTPESLSRIRKRISLQE